MPAEGRPSAHSGVGALHCVRVSRFLEPPVCHQELWQVGTVAPCMGDSRRRCVPSPLQDELTQPPFHVKRGCTGELGRIQ